jgi:quercetin dioxygenase-like cupin family protein
VRLIRSADRPPTDSDPSNFVLPATTQRMLGADDGRALRLYRVAFEAGARTWWHAHDDVQMLYGLSGLCAVVDRSGEEILLGPGDLAVIEAGEEHWHGSADGGPGEHLAINLGEQTTWLESSE